MALKIAVVNELGKHELLKGGNSAGIKAKLFFKFFYKCLRQHHVSHTQCGRNGFGKGV